MDKAGLNLRSNVNIEALDTANFAKSLDKFLYILRNSLSDYAFKAGVMIQVYVRRTDYDLAGVVLCSGEFASKLWQVMVIHDGDRSADFTL